MPRNLYLMFLPFFSVELTACETIKRLQVGHVFFFFYFLHVNPSLTMAETQSNMSQLFIWLSGSLTDQKTKQTTMLCVHLCVTWHKGRCSSYSVNIMEKTPCKHDWIGPAPQHMVENNCGWIYPDKYLEDAVTVYRAGTSYTAAMKSVGCGKCFDSLCQKDISVSVRDT